jgi:transposase
MEKKDIKNPILDLKKALREKAVSAVIDKNMSQKMVAELFGVSQESLSLWVRRYKFNGEVIRNKSVGRPKVGVLGEIQSKRIRNLIIDQIPEQYNISGELWNIQHVKDLILKTEGVKLSWNTVNRTLKRWGFSVFNSPCPEMLNIDQEIFQKWLEKDYPQIYKSSKKEQALIWWGGVAGLNNFSNIESQHTITWTQDTKSQPILINSKPYSVYSLYAISNTSNLYFYISKIYINNSILELFIKNLQVSCSRTIYFIIGFNEFKELKNFNTNNFGLKTKIFFI